MIPLQLTLKNFLSYREAVLDFRGLHTACICGANGVLAEGYKPLFQNYASFRPIPAIDRRKKIVKAASGTIESLVDLHGD